eukprot:2302062-Amphidinium_carterae.1
MATFGCAAKLTKVRPPRPACDVRSSFATLKTAQPSCFSIQSVSLKSKGPLQVFNLGLFTEKLRLDQQLLLTLTK